MATRAYHIVSNYVPPEKKKDGDDSGEDVEDVEESWNRGFAFGPSKRVTNPPKFVKASNLSAAYGAEPGSSSTNAEEDDDDEIQIIGEQRTLGLWYKNLPRTKSPLPPQLKAPRSNHPEVLPISSYPLMDQPSHIPVSDVTEQSTGGAVGTTTPTSAPPKRPRNHGQWFISNVLNSSPADFASPASSSSSLSEMLARAPPPLPSEQPFIPPVWTAIGPSNRGYEMLQRRGWEEGQPLGLAARKNRNLKSVVKIEALEGSLEEETKPTISHPVNPKLRMGKQPETIDLTTIDDSDSAEEDDIHASDLQREILEMSLADTTAKAERDSVDKSVRGSGSMPTPAGGLDASDPGARALLTPLPTILKADRLGIGLRSKHTQKVIHNSSEAFKVHANAARRRRHLGTKAPSSTSGQGISLGAKTLSRRHKQESQSRKEMLGYMNAN